MECGCLWSWGVLAKLQQGGSRGCCAHCCRPNPIALLPWSEEYCNPTLHWCRAQAVLPSRSENPVGVLLFKLNEISFPRRFAPCFHLQPSICLGQSQPQKHSTRKTRTDSREQGRGSTAAQHATKHTFDVAFTSQDDRSYGPRWPSLSNTHTTEQQDVETPATQQQRHQRGAGGADQADMPPGEP